MAWDGLISFDTRSAQEPDVSSQRQPRPQAACKMTDYLSSAPFITSPIGIDVSESEQTIFLDYLGHSTSAGLYFNRSMVSMGLVCGGLIEDVETTVKRLVMSHLSESDSQVIIVHSDNSTLRRDPCSLVGLSGSRPTILTSPRNLHSTSSMYASTGATTVPLRFEENTITTRQLLSFFDPPHDMRNRGSIVNTLQLVISQLREPFDLQHFIELVEKETWTEEGATFLALRQNMLTSLLSSSQPFPWSRREIFVDLDDPLLSSTGLEGVMVDMALQKVLALPPKRRLVVLYNAHEYLATPSPLLRSLEELAALGKRSPTSVIFASPSPSRIPRALFKWVDYLISGHGRSAVWASTLEEELFIHPSANRDPDQLIIWSSLSMHLGNSPTKNRQAVLKPTMWGENALYISTDELMGTMPAPSPSTHSRAEVPSPSEVCSAVNPPATHSPLQEDVEAGIVPLDIAGSVDSTPLPAAPQDDFASAVSTHSEDANPASQSTQGWTQVRKRDPPLPLEQRYPEMFRPLVAGILSLTNRQIDTWVGFEELRAVVSNQQSFGTYTSYVKAGREVRIVELRKKGTSFKSVKLLPFSVRQSYINSVTPSTLVVESCPSRFRPLVSAIIQAGNDDIYAKVSLEELSNALAQVPEVTQPAQFRQTSLPYWIQQACEGEWITKGKVQGKKRMWLGPKLQSVVNPSATPEDLDIRRDRSPSVSPNQHESTEKEFDATLNQYERLQNSAHESSMYDLDSYDD